MSGSKPKIKAIEVRSDRWAQVCLYSPSLRVGGASSRQYSVLGPTTVPSLPPDVCLLLVGAVSRYQLICTINNHHLQCRGQMRVRPDCRLTCPWCCILHVFCHLLLLYVGVARVSAAMMLALLVTNTSHGLGRQIWQELFCNVDVLTVLPLNASFPECASVLPTTGW